MKYSFIGLGKPIGAFNNLLRSHIKPYRMSHFGEEIPLEAGGVFSSNLSGAAAFAGDNDMCVYMSLEELLINSDIIFVFLSDKALRNISLSFGKHDVKNKIFCHFNPAYSADILDFNSRNTYISMCLPYFVKDKNNHTTGEHIIAEGYGKQLDKFKEALSLLNINCSFITQDEMLIYHTASFVARDMPIVLNYTAKRLMRYALASHTELSDKITSLVSDNPSILNTYNPIDAMDCDFVSKQCDALKCLGIDEITKLYLSLVNLCTQIDGSEAEEMQRISSIIKKHF